MARWPTLSAFALPLEMPEAAAGGDSDDGDKVGAADAEGGSADDAVATAARSSGVASATAIGDLDIKNRKTNQKKKDTINIRI